MYYARLDQGQVPAVTSRWQHHVPNYPLHKHSSVVEPMQADQRLLKKPLMMLQEKLSSSLSTLEPVVEHVAAAFGDVPREAIDADSWFTLLKPYDRSAQVWRLSMDPSRHWFFQQQVAWNKPWHTREWHLSWQRRGVNPTAGTWAGFGVYWIYLWSTQPSSAFVAACLWNHQLIRQPRRVVSPATIWLNHTQSETFPSQSSLQ